MIYYKGNYEKLK